MRTRKGRWMAPDLSPGLDGLADLLGLTAMRPRPAALHDLKPRA